jgi:hypothetical protein
MRRGPIWPALFMDEERPVLCFRTARVDLRQQHADAGQPYLAGSASPNGDARARFISIVADDARIEQVIVLLRDGVNLIRQVHA